MDGSSHVMPVPERIEAGNVLDVMSGLGAACSSVSPTGPFTLDFAALRDFDSSALSMLMELSRQRGTPVMVRNPPPKLAELAELYGVAELIFGGGSEGTAA